MPQRQQLSDYTCTALQLANFWQDVFVDYHGKGRIYLPLEDLRRFGVTGEDIAQRRATPQFVAMMKFEVERARAWFARGLPLVKRSIAKLAIDLELFSRVGRRVLNAIERQGFDVLRSTTRDFKVAQTDASAAGGNGANSCELTSSAMPMRVAGASHAVQPRIFITASWCCLQRSATP